MKRIIIAIFCTVISSTASAQLVEKKLIVPLQFQSLIDTNKTVMIPNEYEINVFYTGVLKQPRFMALGPDNAVYVADMGGKHIVKLPDTNHDGIADTAIVVAPDVDTAHSLAFYNGALYVAQPSRVRKFLDMDGDGFYETEEPFITGIGDTGYYNHFTRTILFDTIGKHIYLSVGASCNACREGDSERATILQFNLDGSGRKIFATGLRNAIGLAIDPVSGNLWATNADRDRLGDDLPPEIITSVSQGNFFGWPFAYGNKTWDDFLADPGYKSILPITPADSEKVNSMKRGDFHIPAHSTPMALIFDKNQRRSLLNPGIIAAVHGSSPGGRKIGLGYKVILIQYDYSLESLVTTDFLTGFLTDSVNYTFWGRPCGLVQDTSGDIYLSCDLGIPAIYRIHLNQQKAVRTQPSLQIDFKILPNPASESATINYFLPIAHHIKFSIIDQLGRVTRMIRDEDEDAGEKKISISINDLPAGVYYLNLETYDNTFRQKIVVVR